MTNKLLRETWFDEQTRLWVTCDASSCLVELSIKRPGDSPVVELQVLQQAHDPRGLAIGPAVVIHRERIRYEPGPTPAWCSGRVWLPSRFAGPHIRNCYFRIAPNPRPS